jgi:hypothetical protein
VRSDGVADDDRGTAGEGVGEAAEARAARSELLAGLKSGKVDLAGVFGRGEEEIVKRTRVVQVLRALPGYGPARVAALMATSGVNEKRRIGGPTAAQRERLLEAVAD